MRGGGGEVGREGAVVMESVASSLMGQPFSRPTLRQLSILGSFPSGSKFWLFGVFALLATAVWGTQKAIRPGSEPFRGLIMGCGFFSP